jgi:ATP-dependent DNA helicase RecQ
MRLDGAAAFATLSQLVNGGLPSVDQYDMPEPAFKRMYDAHCDPGSSSLDRAVLMRQALLYEAARRESGPQPAFKISSAHGSDFRDVGLHISGNNVSATEWNPSWLPNPSLGIDSWAASEFERRTDYRCEGDPFLSKLGLSSYRSRRQRAAARAVLTTPPGCTITVALATGEGKSLLFQLIDAIGFNSAGTKVPSVTVVIVPTVALAIDHAGDASIPRAWYAGNDAENRTIADAIRNGTQGLCFASPEAACGPMRRALVEAARLGYLRALVIDEAHMVDSWGTGFRTEFQELSGLHFELRAVAPKGIEPRTVCLSATLTTMALNTLATLFPGSEFRALPAAAMRPEPDYWFAPTCSPAEREDRVLEALFHLPRPAILYVTEVKDAKRWGGRLRDRGFARLRIMHGETPRHNRSELLSSWRNGSVDLVVATSAFGLGINNQHVRTVIHACVPESLDRYYQEVGRGGRDGRSCVSLVVPTPADYQIAKTLSSAVVISVTRGLARWTAMFDGDKVMLGPDRFALRLDAAPGNTDLDIDMINERNTDWNARVLTILARAGILRLLGSPPSTGNEFNAGVWQGVQILNHDHLKLATWEREVERIRSEILADRAANLDLMQEMISGHDDCAASTLRSLYRDVDPACSRCRKCRSGHAQPYPVAADREPAILWPPQPIGEPFHRLLDSGNRLVIFLEDAPGLGARQLKLLLPRVSAAGFRNVVLRGEQKPWILDALKTLEDTGAFVERTGVFGNISLPPTAEAVFFGTDAPISRVNLAPRPYGRERLILLIQGAVFADKPLQPLRSIHNGRIMNLSEFYARTLT